mmetsp:Transcript_456/g.1139  ORF Transcript_456/g.1139 Transcript_456/m.1139 type:complete len:370 (+) Transcript_456:605-1714(+)
MALLLEPPNRFRRLAAVIPLNVQDVAREHTLTVPRAKLAAVEHGQKELFRPILAAAELGHHLVPKRIAVLGVGDQRRVALGMIDNPRKLPHERRMAIADVDIEVERHGDPSTIGTPKTLDRSAIGVATAHAHATPTVRRPQAPAHRLLAGPHLVPFDALQDRLDDGDHALGGGQHLLHDPLVGPRRLLVERLQLSNSTLPIHERRVAYRAAALAKRPQQAEVALLHVLTRRRRVDVHRVLHVGLVQNHRLERHVHRLWKPQVAAGDLGPVVHRHQHVVGYPLDIRVQLYGGRLGDVLRYVSPILVFPDHPLAPCDVHADAPLSQHVIHHLPYRLGHRLLALPHVEPVLDLQNREKLHTHVDDLFLELPF